MAKEILKPNDVQAPTLFVGVGGTGCKIIRKVAEMCHPAERENISFACLDTNVNDLRGVNASSVRIYGIQTSTTQTVGDYLNYDKDALRNWFPKNAVIYDKTVSEGAGQVRAISRLALNSTIKTGAILPLYDAIDDLFRKDGKALKQAMRVVIASTASGGTGSGIVMPLAMFIRDYVKNKYPNTSLIVRSLILLPETLDSVITSAAEKESQRRNAYATIKEINAFMMKGSGFFDVNEDLKRYSDLHVDFSVPGTNEMKSLSLLPFDFCFLLDGQNSEDNTLVKLPQYIDQAARALYHQNIGPMQRDAFSVEDNIIKEMSAPGMFGRNRFGGIGTGTLRYPYEDVVKYVSCDWALDAIGGEGEASKWFKYDHEYDVKIREARKKGLSDSECPTRGEIYVGKMNTSTDNFSKDLRAKYLSNANRRVANYLNSLKTEMVASLNTNNAIGGSRNAANMLANEIDYNDPSNRGQASDNLNKLRSFEAAVRVHAKKTAASAAEAIFMNDAKTINEKKDYTLEAFIKNVQGEVSHPNAIRYMLYMLKAEMDKRMRSVNSQINDVILPALESYSADADDVSTFNANYTRKKKERNLDELCAAEKGEGQEPGLLEKLGGYEKIYETLNSCFPSYFDSINSYANFTAELEAYRMGSEYIGELLKAFEKFYYSFSEKVNGLVRTKEDLLDALKFQKGDSVFHVCCSAELLAELSRSTKGANAENSMLDSELNGKIFDAIKANVAFDRETRNADVVEEDRRIDIFDDILLGYFQNSVRTTCDNLDVNIVEAMAMENRLMARVKARENQADGPVFDKVTAKDNERHILELIQKGRRLAAPGIQKLRSEESREIILCCYNQSLNNMRNYRMDTLVSGAIATDTISRYEMHFFNALYNLTPDKLDKFAAAKHTETHNKNAGLYHNAYQNYARLIGPDSTKGATISTHIDKRWDSVAVLPELDFAFQDAQVMRIHQALIYALIHRAITHRTLSHAAEGKRVYKYENSDERYVDLVVSNGTLCDEFYEILDALYISSSIVEDIDVIRRKKRARDETRNSNYADTTFAKELAAFKLDFLHDGPTSLFEVALAYYNTLPNSKRYTSELTALVDAIIQTLQDELSTWENVNDVKFLLCKLLEEQFNLLMDNFEQYPRLRNNTTAGDNAILDIIFRKIRKVVETTPEPDDYENLIEGMRARLR